MKIFKSRLLLVLVICVTYNFSSAQHMYNVHVDYVKPSKIWEYEKIAKEFFEACKKHNPKANWIVSNTNDDRYLYVSPIKSYADLDINPFKDMAEAMGDSFNNIFERFNTCYDKHSNHIVHLMEELSYMPNGISQVQEGQDYRKYLFLYHTPANYSKLKEAIKEVKDLYVNKKSEEHFRVYRSGFGSEEDYFLVAISYKDEVDAAAKAKASRDLIGEAGKPVFQKVMEHTARFEEVRARMRPDLSFSHKP
ncbi:hypothetical protein IA57_12655 [Mangrovimonas yunxiaonensis]|uniref:NIPSNAP family containing protein n=1 Tax=Mangrovimonas yunxiaonensis TaxID=1197477 RepID=A0A084THS4_9FLAO|nr:hypothetical protein [Mangrovimonas yunxiaonensis]KFB00260.1 hypothetical protein IA57_12655 [Mangrovimonas yunxiaonensis]